MRAAKLSPERRSEIASIAGRASAERAAERTTEEKTALASSGGKGRAEKLSAKRRSAIAKKAAATRWAKQQKREGQ